MEHALSHYRQLYNAQRGNAKARGVGFDLTFQEWCNFWGDDIDRRGTGRDDLQMQRHCDTGPYAIGNISKGTPKRNSQTAANMRLKRISDQAAFELQCRWDDMMNEPSKPARDDWTDDEIELRRFRVKTTYDSRNSMY